MNELATTQTALAPLSEDSPVDDFANALMVLDRLAEVTRDLRETWKARAFERVSKHGPFMVLTRKFFVGHPHDWKCEDIRDAMEELFRATGGDWDAFVSCLSVNALKHGAFKKLVGPELFAKHFRDKAVDRLESKETKPAELLDVDTRYLTI